jgi:thymidylate synthase
VPRNHTDKCIGGEGKAYGKRCMALAGVGGSEQVWHLKHFEKDEHCIYHGEGQQKKIVHGLGNCLIKQYKEEEEQDEDNWYRWVIEKRGMGEKGQQLYSIRNVYWGIRINYDSRENVVCTWNDGEDYEQWLK